MATSNTSELLQIRALVNALMNAQFQVDKDKIKEVFQMECHVFQFYQAEADPLLGNGRNTNKKANS